MLDPVQHRNWSMNPDDNILQDFYFFTESVPYKI